MMEFSAELINQVIADFMLPFARVSALVMTMVGLGAKTTPARIKVAFAVALTVMMMPMIPPVRVETLFSFNLLLLMFQQVLVGVMLGFLTILLLETFTLAGQVIAMQTGLGFASLVDPSSGLNVPAVGQFYLILATLLFWGIDGHLIMIQFVHMSFETIPIPWQGFDAVNFKKISEFGSLLFSAALALALAPITALLLINFSFGVMTRAAPQLNIFTIGFPITMTSGLLIMWLTFGDFYTHFEMQWARVVDFSCLLINCGAP